MLPAFGKLQADHETRTGAANWAHGLLPTRRTCLSRRGYRSWERTRCFFLVIPNHLASAVQTGEGLVFVCVQVVRTVCAQIPTGRKNWPRSAFPAGPATRQGEVVAYTPSVRLCCPPRGKSWSLFL